ncbi:lipase maturation factor family protein [Isoptericola sp. S6320L]|uniref:lipase maturation factor family protein n=1 Tax=Isoptericola sp. S6320L TaxID=2926411 RepID=UPI001FF48ECC|nr:lipase maturation factor family protein [Isoptericola sp. S6320L]MCK0115420.1 lipase maturation factor family protein [Isoptericola sp. S6320L]
MPAWTTWLESWWAAGDYDVARQVLQRGVGVLLCLAFLQALGQFRPLLGDHGLTPVRTFTAQVRFRDAPSLFQWRYSDRLLATVAWTGVVGAASLVAGLPQAGPWWVPTLVLLVLWWFYLSIVNVGQRFYGFGWEMLLCEMTFLVAWFGSEAVPVPFLLVLAARWLLFRVELGAGLIKWRGGREWRDLTALDFHHETQPMPGPLSWHAHHLPRWWHRVEVVGTHVSQLGVPWLLWLPQPLPSIAGVVVVLTQGWLVVTGNFAWLNWATIVLGAAMISDGAWSTMLGAVGPGPDGAQAGPSPDLSVAHVVAVAAVVTVLAVLSVRPARNLASRHQSMNASFEPWRLVNAYGAFGSVTRRREEVVVEGTLAPHPGPGDWQAYEFRGKPGDVRRRPPQVAPYHLRLDWLLWFVPLGSGGTLWFERLLLRLLEADRATLRLLRHDPFGGERPRWVRARLYRYRFSTPEERRRTGDWWVRREVAVVVDPVSLSMVRR